MDQTIICVQFGPNTFFELHIFLEPNFFGITSIFVQKCFWTESYLEDFSVIVISFNLCMTHNFFASQIHSHSTFFGKQKVLDPRLRCPKNFSKVKLSSRLLDY